MKDWYEKSKELYKKFDKKESEKLINEVKEKFNIEHTYKQFANVELIRNDNGLVDAKQTLLNVHNLDKNLFYTILFTGHFRNRSALYKGEEQRLRYNVLVPLFMAAHKQYNGVGYEEWDKSVDTWYLKYVVGFKLYNDIEPFLQYVPEVDDNLLELRTEALAKTKAKAGARGYYVKRMYAENYGYIQDLANFIKGQFWMANVVNRHKFMILDTVNWDNIPEAFDVKDERPVITRKREVEELPF
jgi:hypothetical protein